MDAQVTTNYMENPKNAPNVRHDMGRDDLIFGKSLHQKI